MEKSNFHPLKYQRIGSGYYPECGQIKGKSIFTKHTISPQQAINKCLLAQRCRTSWWQTRTQAPGEFLRIFPLLRGFSCWILIAGSLGWILLHLVHVPHQPTISFHPEEQKAAARGAPSPRSSSHGFCGGQRHALQSLACPENFTT